MTFWNLQNDPVNGKDSVLDIDGEIVADAGWWTADGCCVARDFREALSEVRNVTVRINSPGGDVIAGAEIYAALREHSDSGKGTVRVVITALAASAASVIAMAGDQVDMYPTSYMMIHNPWTLAMGDSKELRRAAKNLDIVRDGIVNAYMEKTGKSREELQRMLEAETWMSADVCVENGFADHLLSRKTDPYDLLIRPAAQLRTQMSAKRWGAERIAALLREDAGGTEPETRPEISNTDLARRACLRRRAEVIARMT